MKKSFTFIILCTLLFSKITAQSEWNYNFENALKLSKAFNKPILVDFMATWCGPCKMMDRNVWSKEDIKVLKNNFISVKIDIDVYSSIASKYEVRAIPNIMILDSYGTKLFSSLGYKKKQEVAKFLDEFSINLASINGAMLILDKSKQNVYSNIRVAQKYQDAALVLKGGKVHKSFLMMSNRYLKNAEKIKKTKPLIVEKIDLLKLLNRAYFHHAKSVLKFAQKKFKSVDDTNLALFTFIKFYATNDLNQKDKAMVLLSDLQHAKNNSSYLKKANFILNKH